jgi:hypothetical protein
MKILASTLSGKANEADCKVLIDAIGTGMQGDDAVVLAAIACRRAGGDSWNAFRANARDILGNQPLSGGVVVLVNRLSTAPFTILAGTTE